MAGFVEIRDILASVFIPKVVLIECLQHVSEFPVIHVSSDDCLGVRWLWSSSHIRCSSSFVALVVFQLAIELEPFLAWFVSHLSLRQCRSNSLCPPSLLPRRRLGRHRFLNFLQHLFQVFGLVQPVVVQWMSILGDFCRPLPMRESCSVQLQASSLPCGPSRTSHARSSSCGSKEGNARRRCKLYQSLRAETITNCVDRCWPAPNLLRTR